MILSLTFNGYRFFDDTTLSFVADCRTKKLLSNASEIDGKNVLKAVGLYGPNNSGKTNIATLFAILKNVLNGRERLIFNFPVFDDPIETNISVIFNNMNGSGWFKYECTYDNKKLLYMRESLSKLTFYESGNISESVLFERDNFNGILNIFGESKGEYLLILPSRLPFLYSVELEIGDFSVLKEYLNELQSLANSIEVIRMYDIPYENTLNTMKKDDIKKINFIKEFVKNADIEINNFEFDNSIVFQYPNEINEVALKRLMKDFDSFKLMTTYGNKKVPSLIFDSTGTKKIEAIASYIYDALVEKKTLVIDELDNGLHYKLTRSIVSVFNNMINSGAQLLFITHDLLLIDCNNLMRKDQIYFINRNEAGARLYPLKEATASEYGIRDVSEIVKHYNRGEFGAIPNPSFMKTIIGVLGSNE